jgi:hypothetical protein
MTLAFICLTLASRGNTEPHNAASYVVHGCADSKVWPKRVAERKAKLAAEYSQWFDAVGNLKPEIPKKDSATTPPSLADSGAELPSNPRSTQSAPLLHFPDKETA